MTDAHAPLTDEDLSAALDGAADSSVLERLASDPAGQARYRALESARDLLGATPPAPLAPAQVEDLVQRALAAADELAAPPPGSVAPVTPLAAPPPPSRRRTGPPLWSVAAVVAALVAVGIGLIWSDQGSDGGDTAVAPTTGLDLEDSLDRGQAGPHSSTPEPTVAPKGEVPAPLIDLGEFASKEDLRTALAEGWSSTGALVDPEVAPSTATVQRCGTQVAALLQGEDIGPAFDRRAFAQVDGSPYLVYEFALTEAADDDTHLVSAVDPVACDPLVTFYR